VQKGKSRSWSQHVRRGLGNLSCPQMTFSPPPLQSLIQCGRPVTHAVITECIVGRDMCAHEAIYICQLNLSIILASPAKTAQSFFHHLPLNLCCPLNKDQGFSAIWPEPTTLSCGVSSCLHFSFLFSFFLQKNCTTACQLRLCPMP
jgi:hypothetical protein